MKEIFMQKNKGLNLGFTLIELLVYLGIVVLILTAAIQFAWQIIYGRLRSQAQLELNYNLRFLSDKLNYEIRRSNAINSLSNGNLSLAQSPSGNDPVVFSLNNGRVYFGKGSGGNCDSANPCALTSNRVSVDSLNFTQMQNGQKVSIKYEFTIEHNNPSGLNELNQNQTYTSTITLR